MSSLLVERNAELKQAHLQALKDGIILCEYVSNWWASVLTLRLLNVVRPGSVSVCNDTTKARVCEAQWFSLTCKDNINNYLQACKKLGFSMDQLFTADDLMSGQKLTKVSPVLHNPLTS